MKRFMIICCLLITTGIASAQETADTSQTAKSGAGQVSGAIVDVTGAGMEFANVVIFSNAADSTKRQLLQGANTDSAGRFSLDGLPLNTPLRLRVTNLGFSDLNTDFILTDAQQQKSMGNLQIKKDKTELKEVTVSATKAYMTIDMDKKVYNTARDVVSIGGTGLDVVKNVPGVNVDVDGNVAMRGQSPQIFVDGKPTILTLDQIPASAIESVEVISNPSAKYDASGGGAGILNVVLKKNRKTGYNGNLRAGLDSHGGYNGGGSLNLRTKKFNISGDFNARKSPDYTKANTNRSDFSSSPMINLAQQQMDTSKNAMLFGKLSVDYYLTKSTTLSLSAFAVHHTTHGNSDLTINTDTVYSAGNISGMSNENINTTRSFNGRGATLGMKHDFKKKKEVWTIDANYFSGTASGNSDYATNFYSDPSGTSLANQRLQQIQSSGKDYNIVLQSDYSNPLTKNMTLEAGVRAAFQGRRNYNDNYTYDFNTDDYNLVPTAASNYKSNSNVYAAYTILAGNLGKFTYKAGLRLESSGYNGLLLNSGETFKNSFPVSLFPSLFVGRKLGDNDEVQLSYTRRVNRPNFFQLVPYTDSSNPLNITRGNPNLIPEFTQSLELSYIKTLSGIGTLMGSVYYKHTDHLITGYIESDTNATGNVSFINTYINAASSYSTGAELTGQFSLTKWWDLTSNVNIYRSKINLGDDISGSQQDALWNWFGKLNMNFKLPAGFGIQLTGTYQSKSNIPVSTGGNQPGPPDMMSQTSSQGYINSYYYVDMAIKKDFHKGKIIASLSASDIFKTRKQDQFTYSDYFTQDYSRLKNPQLVRFSLSYNFGKLENKPQDRKNVDIPME
jgi:outer membrane receptor protein involved in Fe transport